ncbi:ATP-dependent Clp protease adaptor ClpS [Sulfurimonas sp.]|uniref:ATP-dependent Clp protease adaptor ClpS n=1 Tax=Sulfurimonas sp. TaxID=2022749 RepID=UPI002AB158EE|nr:ATP-dependent Clp protease adaptor ClpS [Sulfurimonas sp.]
MPTHTDIELLNEVKIKHPKKYKVYLLNDDYTSMEFVIEILITIFYKNYEDAQNVMLDIHKKEKGLCGVYTHEIAETKIIQVHQKAKDNGFPLKAVMEQE